MTYDSRTIANFILDRADGQAIKLTNAEVNKIVYFLHALYLAKFSEPLISAKIEAWDYGPVVREIYSEFKSFGPNPITHRASRFDTKLLKRVKVEEPISREDIGFLEPLVDRYARFGVGKLIGMSHERGGPWDLVYNNSDGSNPGMEISNELIRDYFANQTRH